MNSIKDTFGAMAGVFSCAVLSYHLQPKIHHQKSIHGSLSLARMQKKVRMKLMGRM
jgi:hypothetical protein